MREKTNITLHPTVKKQASVVAKAEGRSLSEMIERLLEAAVKAANEKGESLQRSANRKFDRAKKIQGENK